MRITILDAAPKILTKQFSLVNGELVKKDYDRCFTYAYSYAECNCLQDLYEVLEYLAAQPTKCIIRGELNPNVTNISKVRRKKLAVSDPFRENKSGVDFIMVDFDKIKVPEWLPTDLDYYLEFLISTLPDYMKDVSYVYQWSSQAGMDSWETLRCHIWFWLTEPRTDTQAEDWAKSLTIDDYKPIDPCTMRTVQPNYTASPIFNEGVQDPLLGKRVGIVKKKFDTVYLPIIKEKQKIQNKKRISAIASGPMLIPKGLETKFDLRLAAIGPDYHLPITQAVASWISLTNANSNIERLKERLRDRIVAAPGSGSAGQDHYLSDAYLDAEIRGCPFPSKVEAPDRMPETKQERIRYALSNGKQI